MFEEVRALCLLFDVDLRYASLSAVCIKFHKLMHQISISLKILQSRVFDLNRYLVDGSA